MGTWVAVNSYACRDGFNTHDPAITRRIVQRKRGRLRSMKLGKRDRAVTVLPPTLST
jgi:hypothetical protein